MSPIKNLKLTLLPLICILLIPEFLYGETSKPFIRWHWPFNKIINDYSPSDNNREEKEKEQQSPAEEEANEQKETLTALEAVESAQEWESAAAHEYEEPYIKWKWPFNRVFNQTPYSSPGIEIPELPKPAQARFQIESPSEKSVLQEQSYEAKRFEMRYLNPSHLFLKEEAYDPNNENSSPRFSLEEAIEQMLYNNLDIQVQDLQSDLEHARLDYEKGIFDPVFESSFTYQRSELPQNTQEFTSTGGAFNFGQPTGEPNIFTTETWQWRNAFTGRIDTGLTYELSLEMSSLENSLNRTSTSALFSPEYGSNLNIRLTQPLLREFGQEVNLAQIRIARKNKEIAHQELEGILMTTALQVLTSYFDFIYAYHELKIRTAELKAFQTLVDNMKERLEKGMTTNRQVAHALSQSSESHDQMLTAKQRLFESRNHLYEMVGIHNNYRPDAQHALPFGQFSEDIPKIMRTSLIKSTLANSPELLRTIKEWERDKLELTLAEDQLDPQLNLVLGTGLSGLDNSSRGSITSSYGRSTYSAEIGLVYTRPWGNDQAEARVRQAKIKKRQTALDIKRVQHQAVARALRVYDSLQIQKERVEVIQSLRVLMAEEVNHENILVEKGEKSVYETIEYYRDLYDTRLRELNILLELNRNKANLWLANGSLLERLGIIYLDD